MGTAFLFGIFDCHKKGEILSEVTNDLEKVADTLQDGLTQLFSAVVGIAGGSVMMTMIRTLLTLIAVGTIFAFDEGYQFPC